MVFIIPLKSATVSSDWTKCSKLFERCLHSVCQQTDPDFKVVVVCHELPETSYTHPNVEYIQVDFPPPIDYEVGVAEFHGAREEDKMKKIRIGVEYAQQLGSTHVMIVDADDCISDKISAFVKRHPAENGWYSQAGYIYKEGSQLIFKKVHKFNSLCGTCLILKPELVEDLITNGTRFDHAKITLRSQEKLKPLPFAAAVYSINNGENYFMNKKAVSHLNSTAYKNGLTALIKKALRYRVWPLTSKIKNHYGLTPIN